MRAETGTRPGREWTADDDAHLECLLALRRLWHERDARVTLPDCDLEPKLVTFVVSGLCPRHGQFVVEWTGRPGDPLPLEARCSAGRCRACSVTSPVFVLV
jgi:hypothetical protein